MEILFNLIWAAVIATLWAFWAAGRRFPRKASLRPSTGVQLIALVMLSAIVLPVISITDDLQAYHNPAEVQRTVDRNDRHPSIGNSPHNLPATPALPVLRMRSQHLRTVALLTIDEAAPSRQIVYSQVLRSRPPPAA